MKLMTEVAFWLMLWWVIYPDFQSTPGPTLFRDVVLLLVLLIGTVALSGILSTVIWKVIDWLVPLPVPAAEEQEQT